MDTTNNPPFTSHVTGVSKEAAQYGHNVGTTPKKRGQSLRLTKPSTSSPVTTLQVSAAVWQKALELSGGDARRIQIISTTEVVVHNHPYAWM